MDTIMHTETQLEAHPFTRVWPSRDEVEFMMFKDDVQAHGQRLPILTYEGLILDGRDRYQACLDLGLPPIIEKAQASNDKEAIALMVSLNLRRRHLTYEQRGFIAADLAKLRQGARGPGRAKVSDETYGRTEAAEKMGVSVMAVSRAKAVAKHGLKQDVLDGKLSLNAAYEKVRKNKSEPKPKPPTKHLADRIPKMPPRNRPALTKEMVDPEFVGTDMEFAHEYGHVYTQTAEERATSRLHDLATTLAVWAKHQTQYPVKPVDINWLRSPRAKDVEKLRKAYDVIFPLIDGLQTLLLKAEAIVKGELK